MLKVMNLPTFGVEATQKEKEELGIKEKIRRASPRYSCPGAPEISGLTHKSNGQPESGYLNLLGFFLVGVYVL